MSQESAQDLIPDGGFDPNSQSPFPEGIKTPINHFKKFLPFIILFSFILMSAAGYTLVSRKFMTKPPVPLPTPRPTATPKMVPTIPEVSPTIIATPSASISPIVTPANIGRLAFIKDGDIWSSDMETISLLVKNATPASDLLSWSPKGNFLSWREKDKEASASSLIVYDKTSGNSSKINPEASVSAEVLDYAWSADEKAISILYHDAMYKISLFSLATPSSAKTDLVQSPSVIRQVFWPGLNRIIYTGDEGIKSIKTDLPENVIVLTKYLVYYSSISPDGKRILYSVGNNKVSNLYLLNIDGSNQEMLPTIPQKIDMGETGLSPVILKDGYAPFAVWFPKSDKLLVGYHYLTNLPLVGIYTITDRSFKAIAPFVFDRGDLFFDDLRLIGQRENITGSSSSSSQLSVFTMEDKSKLGTIRVIPGGSSAAFFSH